MEHSILMGKVKIAVIGTGPAGLAALKSLREEGFDAVGFDRRPSVGGLWSYSSEPSWTSVARDTVCNISKFVSGFSDFPLPKDCPLYLSAAQVEEYFQSYARHFGLDKHIRFDTTVRRVTRSKLASGWEVQVSGPEGDAVHCFDKVVVCTGCETLPVWPQLAGKELYTGEVLHGQQYKGPDKFSNKRVMVVGMGNTACEVALSLCECAAQVLQAYRRGRITVSRFLDNGMPTDSTISWPWLRLKYLLDDRAPWLSEPLVHRFMIRKMIGDAARAQHDDEDASRRVLTRRERLRRAERRVKHEWRLIPCANMAHQNPAVQEYWTAALDAEDIVPVRGFKAFLGGKRVLLDDESVVEADAVVFCTGYTHNWSMMPDLEMDGATKETPVKTAGQLQQDEEARDGPTAPHIPRLYHMMFPPQHASSVAFLSWMAPQENVWCVSELASMALAQIWAAETARASPPSTPSSLASTAKQQPVKGSTSGTANYAVSKLSMTHVAPSLLPSLDDMNAHVDAYHIWWRRQWQREPSVRQGVVRAHTFYRFLHAAAGTGLYERLDHPLSGRGIRLRWHDAEVYRWLAKGPINSHAWRLFDTNPHAVPGCGRRAWTGARDAIRIVYESHQECKRRVQEQKRIELKGHVKA